MREYELTVIYDLAVAETGGADASVQLVTTAIETRGGKMLRVDHWGRRRMAYPINRALDGDYIVSRVELDPTVVDGLEAGFKIDERVYRHLIVRADELPVPPPPREPRRPREEAPAPVAEAPAAPAAEAPAAPAETAAPVAEAPVAAAAAPKAEAPAAVADETPAVAEAPATPAAAEAMGEAEASPAPVAAEDAPEPGTAPPSGTIAETDPNA